MRNRPRHLKRTARRSYLTGFLLTVSLLELAVIIYLLLPSGQEQAKPSRLAAVIEAPRLEQRLSARFPQMKTETTDTEKTYVNAEVEDISEPAEEEPEIVEKEKPEGELSATEILANEQLIAHGMGAIGDLTIPNCLEGFLAQYEAGIRVFEADLRLTRDVKVVLRHDWWGTWQEGIDWGHIPTREKFVSEKIQGEYMPLSFRDLLLLMEEYPDICIITDSKFTESDIFTIQFDAMLADAHELGLTYLFDRIVVQVYNGNMRTGLNNIYPFPHYIYTLYQDATFKGTADSFREKAAYCAERGIEGITMNESLWKPAFASIAEEYGIAVYVHTVNDTEKAQKLLNEGVSGIYTDSIKPTDIA